MPISAPFALHQLPGIGGAALATVGRVCDILVRLRTQERLRTGRANEGIDRVSAVTRAILAPRRVRTGARLLKSWKASNTFLNSGE